MSLAGIEKIKKAEAEAQDIIKEADAEAAVALENAKREAISIINEAERIAEQDYRAELDKASEEAERIYDDIIKDTDNNCKIIKDNAKKNLDKAVTYIVKEV